MCICMQVDVHVCTCSCVCVNTCFHVHGEPAHVCMCECVGQRWWWALQVTERNWQEQYSAPSRACRWNYTWLLIRVHYYCSIRQYLVKIRASLSTVVPLTTTSWHCTCYHWVTDQLWPVIRLRHSPLFHLKLFQYNMWHVKHRCHGPRYYGFWCFISVSCEPLWYSLSKKGACKRLRVATMASWSAGEGTTWEPMEDASRSEQQFYVHQICASHFWWQIQGKQFETTVWYKNCHMYMQKGIFYTTHNTSMRLNPVITAKEKIKY